MPRPEFLGSSGEHGGFVLIGLITVDGKNPKQPPEMYKTL